MFFFSCLLFLLQSRKVESMALKEKGNAQFKNRGEWFLF